MEQRHNIHHKHIENNQIQFNYPPFIDGTYEQVVGIIRNVFNHGIIKRKEYEQLFIGHVYDLKEKEEKPIKFIKRWAKARASNVYGEIQFTIPFLNAMPDDAKLSEEEMKELIDKIESIFQEYGYEYEKCPFPLSKEEILNGKKSIINRVYYEEVKESYPYGVITNEIFHDKRKK